VRVEEPTGEAVLAPDLEAWLARREGAVPDLVPGTEMGIRWANPADPAPTDLSIVFLHGFTATRREVHPLFERVADELGANVFYARLRGHGRDGGALGDVEVRHWLEDAVEAYAIGKRIGRRVVVAGSSTGGTLAVWLAARRSDDALAALVLLSPNLAPRAERWRLLLRPWGGLAARLFLGPTAGFPPENEGHARWWTERYPTEALLPMAGLVALVEEIDGADVTVPVLTFVAPDDAVVDPEVTPT
jgi:esterase/lipase